MAYSCKDPTQQLIDSLNTLNVSVYAARRDICNARNKFEEEINQAQRTALLEFIQKVKAQEENIRRLLANVRDLRTRVSKDITMDGQLELERLFDDYDSMVERPDIPDLKVLDTLTSNSGISNGMSDRCGGAACKTCDHMTKSSTFVSNATRKTYKISKTMNCCTTNVIYLFSCERCKLQYVGETAGQLRLRVNHHRSKWNTSATSGSAVAAHVYFNSHTFDDLRLIAIDHDAAWTDVQRKENERYWIEELHTMSPFGMNHKM